LYVATFLALIFGRLIAYSACTLMFYNSLIMRSNNNKCNVNKRRIDSSCWYSEDRCRKLQRQEVNTIKLFIVQ
jgi:hypothetical protein